MKTNTHIEESVQRISPPRAIVTTVGELVQDVAIALVSVAFGFHAFEWSLAASFAWVSAMGLLLTLMSGVTGWLVFQQSQSVFARSKRELRQNIKWLKRALTRSRPITSNQ